MDMDNNQPSNANNQFEDGSLLLVNIEQNSMRNSSNECLTDDEKED